MACRSYWNGLPTHVHRIDIAENELIQSFSQREGEPVFAKPLHTGKEVIAGHVVSFSSDQYEPPPSGNFIQIDPVMPCVVETRTVGVATAAAVTIPAMHGQIFDRHWRR
jgi:hypothetical protein